jgi:hypothetical protein
MLPLDGYHNDFLSQLGESLWVGLFVLLDEHAHIFGKPFILFSVLYGVNKSKYSRVEGALTFLPSSMGLFVSASYARHACEGPLHRLRCLTTHHFPHLHK